MAAGGTAKGSPVVDGKKWERAIDQVANQADNGGIRAFSCYFFIKIRKFLQSKRYCWIISDHYQGSQLPRLKNVMKRDKTNPTVVIN